MPCSRYVTLAIDKAVLHGFLAEGSNAGCLIVPAHYAQQGLVNPNERCPVDHIRTARKHRRQAQEKASCAG